MKQLFKAVLIFAVSCFLLNVNAQDSNLKPPVIEVQGDAVIKVVPDLMRWYLSVKVDDDEVAAAKKNNDVSVMKVLELLKEKGVEPKDIQTSGVRISKNNDEYNKTVKKYNVLNEIWFTSKDISKYDEFTSDLIVINNLFINNIMLDYSKSIETRIQARTDAILAAKKKAEEMAGVLGQSIGKPVYISEGAVNYYPNPFNSVTYTPESNYSPTSAFSEGTINVEAKVKVIFELINQ